MKSLWMLSSSFFFSLMAVFVKMGGEAFGSLELIFYRSIVGVVLIYAFVRTKGFTVKTPYLWGHFKRSFIGTVSMSIWFVSLTMLPVGTSMTLSYTTPLFMALFVFFYSLYRKKPLQWDLMATIFMGFVGVCFVFQPSISAGDELGALLALSSGLLSCLAYWQIKELGQLKEPSWRIVFYFTIFGTFYGLIGCFAFEGGLSPINMDNIWYLVGMALCATLAQISLTMAFGQGNLLLTSCLQFSAIIFAETFGVIFFADAMSLETYIGMAIILVAGVSASMLTKRSEKTSKP